MTMVNFYFARLIKFISLSVWNALEVAFFVQKNNKKSHALRLVLMFIQI
jgi:hypothetical protein